MIRLEQSHEHRQVEHLVREAFWNVYRPGCYEHYLLHILRDHPDFIPRLNYVMEKDGEIIGQIVFVKASITAADGKIIPVLTMGPICIAPSFQRQGYGKILLDFALQKATEYGAGAIFLEGDRAFYGQSGFIPAADLGIRYHGLPEGEDASFFLGKELIPGYLAGICGEYATSTAYFVEDEDVDAFDRSFPPKVKLKLPGQLF